MDARRGTRSSAPATLTPTPAMKLPTSPARNATLALLTAMLPWLTPTPGRAEKIWAATSTLLSSFDSATPLTLQSSTTITGLTAGYGIRAMDFRPSNGLLYALAYNSSAATPEQLYTLNLSTGAATLVGSLGVDFGASFGGMAFDPVADVIRLTRFSNASNGQIRIDPATGAVLATDTALAYAPGDANSGAVTNLEGLAYSPAAGGATTAYGMVWSNTLADNRLVRIGDVGGSPAGAASGQVHTIGSLGIASIGNSWTMDISEATGIAYATDTSNRFFTINLTTGASTLIGSMAAGSAYGLAVAPVPEPGSALLLAVGGALALGRRRRMTI